jgi:hypothetical protein
VVEEPEHLARNGFDDLAPVQNVHDAVEDLVRVEIAVWLDMAGNRNLRRHDGQHDDFIVG